MFKKTIIATSVLLSLMFSATSFANNNAEVNVENNETYSIQSIKNGNLIPITKEVSDLLKVIGANATGFKTGPDFSQTGKSPVIIFFDTNCPYCNSLWQSSMDTKNKDVSFLWVPISVINENKSLQEGAILLDNQQDIYQIMSMISSSKNSTMDITSIYTPTEKSVNDIQKNTLLFHKLGFNSVPTTMKISGDKHLYIQYGEISATDLNTIGNY